MSFGGDLGADGCMLLQQAAAQGAAQIAQAGVGSPGGVVAGWQAGRGVVRVFQQEGCAGFPDRPGPGSHSPLLDQQVQAEQGIPAALLDELPGQLAVWCMAS